MTSALGLQPGSRQAAAGHCPARANSLNPCPGSVAPGNDHENSRTKDNRQSSGASQVYASSGTLPEGVAPLGAVRLMPGRKVRAVFTVGRWPMTSRSVTGPADRLLRLRGPGRAGRVLRAGTYAAHLIDDYPVLVGKAPGPSRQVLSSIATTVPAAAHAKADEEQLYDVLSPVEFDHELAESLISTAPDLTGHQIAEVRQSVLEFATKNGWSDD
jgi:hypothetical protein